LAVQVARQPLVLQASTGEQVTGAAGGQGPPCPVQKRAGVNTAPMQVAGAQLTVAAVTVQAPLVHVPVLPQGRLAGQRP
jgi:hypothetical protein